LELLLLRVMKYVVFNNCFGIEFDLCDLYHEV